MEKNLISLYDFNAIFDIDNQYSKEFITTNQAIVVSDCKTEITVAVTEDVSNDTKLIIEKFHYPKKVNFVYASKKEFVSFIASNIDSNNVGEKSLNIASSKFTLDSIEQDAPIVNIINAIIIDALKVKASDIHLEVINEYIHIRYRIDGVLRTVKKLNKDIFASLSSRIKIMANLNIMEQRLPQDGRITVNIEGSAIDIRVSIVPVTNGEAIALRLFNFSAKSLNIEELGFSDDCLAALKDVINIPYGLILVTGPTGSGKTTTLHSLLKLLPFDSLKIITLEDPVEQIIPGITQIQINEHIGISFDSMLRRVLRHDPNVILIGEIRDSKTAELAIRAALTGHLILATLHTNDSVSAITRLMDMGVEPYLLASVLKCVIAQRLVRKLCKNCCVNEPLTDEVRKLFTSKSIDVNNLKSSKGCDVCHSSGYIGRTVVSEYFTMTPKLEEMISEKKSIADIRTYLCSQNMIKLLDDGLKKVSEGITSLAELNREVR